MYQLAYVSTFGLSVGAQAFAEILACSRANNRRDGVSGILIADGMRFLQVLEGERAKVEAAFARISADQRHFAVFQLTGRDITEREFGEWDMAYRQVNTAADSRELTARAELMMSQLPEGEIKDRLRHFLRLDRQIL